ncbi:low molecular weight protein-tyrosine-phosphatase [Prosthecobacter sp.]|uniref:low molecular weight protein-tyrosine-phosphatase n=1 Tax=Prosthecobacter sp. TaxID=1965333 RepID=UPI002ABC57FA|nr:low molecular weight protein-tyrosine-phosphatase [Prosthecobacter sp.]MDZ4403793.1 low molecular weight protein-tyrosine-phosphatase [Prosthecobacter sp.]
MAEPFRLLFVCLGNICRSPAAEGVMRALVESEGLADRVAIRSAGTGGWHAGKLPDQRMRSAAQNRGYDLSSRARQVSEEDLREHDLVLVMDQQNQREIRSFDCESQFGSKIRLFCEFCTDHDTSEVPDPYYGGEQGFEDVLNLLEDGCRGVLQHIRSALA